MIEFVVEVVEVVGVVDVFGWFWGVLGSFGGVIVAVVREKSLGGVGECGSGSAGVGWSVGMNWSVCECMWSVFR